MHERPLGGDVAGPDDPRLLAVGGAQASLVQPVRQGRAWKRTPAPAAPMRVRIQVAKA